ncbi:MAG: DUF1761 domain-containing protein [Thermoplasmata archaeon]
MVNIDPGTINYLAVIAAGVVSWVLGGIWYARPALGGRWMNLVGMTEEQAREGGAVAFIVALVLSIVVALFLAFVLQALGAMGNVGNGILGGLLVWFGFMAIPAVGNVLFEKRPWGLFGINQGYNLVSFVLMGIILSLWV